MFINDQIEYLRNVHSKYYSAAIYILFSAIILSACGRRISGDISDVMFTKSSFGQPIGVDEGRPIAARKLTKITYSNKYKASLFGTAVDVQAVTFQYKVEPMLEGFESPKRVYEGSAKAALNPDTGKWELINMDLSDPGSQDVLLSAILPNSVSHGINLILLVDTNDIATTNRVMEILRRRIDDLGLVSRISSVRGFQNQIIVELPAVDESERVKAILLNMAQLDLCLIERNNGGPFDSIEAAVDAQGEKFPADYHVLLYREIHGGSNNVQYIVVNKNPVATGKDLTAVRRVTGNGTQAVEFSLTPDASERLLKHVGERIAIAVDSMTHSVQVPQKESIGQFRLQGFAEVQQADDLALLLRSGALPASVSVIEEQER
jgi:hypothetical protein